MHLQKFLERWRANTRVNKSDAYLQGNRPSPPPQGHWSSAAPLNDPPASNQVRARVRAVLNLYTKLYYLHLIHIFFYYCFIACVIIHYGVRRLAPNRSNAKVMTEGDHNYMVGGASSRKNEASNGLISHGFYFRSSLP